MTVRRLDRSEMDQRVRRLVEAQENLAWLAGVYPYEQNMSIHTLLMAASSMVGKTVALARNELANSCEEWERVK